MSSAVLEEILEGAEQALPPEERQQIREVLSLEETMPALVGILLALGLLYVLEQKNVLPLDESRRLHDLLDLELLNSGLMDKAEIDRAEVVRAVRGKYAHLGVSSEAFVAQKREEVELENRR